MNNLLTLLEEKKIQLNADKTRVLNSSGKKTQVIPLIHQRVLSIKGPETEKFLQGQLSCDVNNAFKTGSSLGSHCNIKGHMLSLFRLLKAGSEEAWLRMSQDIFESATANLQKYMIFSKAEAQAISHTISGIGLVGPGAQTLIERWFGNSPSETNSIISLSNGLIVRVPGDRFEIWMDDDAVTEIVRQLPEEVGIGSTNDWILSEIDAGIPDLRAETQEAFIPQMTNFQVFAGISFTKGCYTGQEIITRLQHRGQLKKPMYLAEVSTDQEPQVGETISAPNKPNAGRVVLSAQCGENRYRILAVIVKNLAEEGALSLHNQAVELKTLPYTLDPKLFLPK
ncbi:CAF17-like 4Fe-4S cluster assembly/insertion protein YgfZ [Neptuniibacter marinus]|uniref:CAF17-like 4Fe-4S cluster assembly/insertion protein YgfZ n=1 Tax=Neptuniibacter marinus TaxID=1806670 RepID=UPI0008308EBE|nr:folate-binding protein YgfZ [Neptuniibacter marinus]